MWQPPASCIGSIFNSRKHCYHTFNWQKLLFFLQLELCTLGTSGSVGNGWNGDECMTDSPFPPSPVRSSNSSRNDHMGGKQFLPVSKWFQHCEVLSTNNESLRYSPPCLCRQCMTTSPPQPFKTFMIPNLKVEKLLRFHFLFEVLPNAIFNTSFLPCHLSFSSTVLLIPLSSSSRTFAHFSFCIFKKKLWIVGIKLLFHLCVWFYRHPHHLKMQQ